MALISRSVCSSTRSIGASWGPPNAPFYHHLHVSAHVYVYTCARFHPTLSHPRPPPARTPVFRAPHSTVSSVHNSERTECQACLCTTFEPRACCTPDVAPLSCSPRTHSCACAAPTLPAATPRALCLSLTPLLSAASRELPSCVLSPACLHRCCAPLRSPGGSRRQALPCHSWHENVDPLCFSPNLQAPCLPSSWAAPVTTSSHKRQPCSSARCHCFFAGWLEV